MSNMLLCNLYDGKSVFRFQRFEQNGLMDVYEKLNDRDFYRINSSFLIVMRFSYCVKYFTLIRL